MTNGYNIYTIYIVIVLRPEENYIHAKDKCHKNMFFLPMFLYLKNYKYLSHQLVNQMLEIM